MSKAGFFDDMQLTIEILDSGDFFAGIASFWPRLEIFRSVVNVIKTFLIGKSEKWLFSQQSTDQKSDLKLADHEFARCSPSFFL